VVIDGKEPPVGGRWFIIIVAVMLGSIIAIVVMNPLGLAYDYPNHLARTHIEAFIWTSEHLQRYYALSFDLIPDLMMDMTVPWLAHLTGTYAAGAVAVAIALLLPPLAGLSISRILAGNSTPWLALFGFVPLFGAPIAWGFVNFVASGGIALFALLAWARMESGLQRSAIMLPIGVFLFFSHALAFLLFGYLALLWELSGFVASRRDMQKRSLMGFIKQLVLVDSWAFLPALVLLVLAVTGAEDLQATRQTFKWVLPYAGLIAPFNFFNATIAVALAIGFYGFFLVGLLAGWIVISRRLAIVCGGLFLLVLVMPEGAFGIWGLNFRFGTFFAIILAASCRPGTVNWNLVRGGVIALIGMVAIGQAHAHYQMGQIDAAMNRLSAAFAKMEPGTALLAARQRSARDHYLYLGEALAVIQAEAFVTNLFTTTSPVDVVDTMRPMHLPDAKPVYLDELLAAIDLPLPEAENGYWSPNYYYSWPQHYQYLLCFKPASATRCLDLSILQPIAGGPEFDLYRIAPDDKL